MKELQNCTYQRTCVYAYLLYEGTFQNHVCAYWVICSKLPPCSLFQSGG